MKTLIALIAGAALAMPALANSNFRGIVGDAANIQRDAEKLNADLKSKTPDESKIKSDVAALGADIAKLKKDVEEIESHTASFNAEQKKNWELVKTKVQLLTIFHEQKQNLLNSGDLKKNRSMLRAHASGIAKRAQMLQQTASRLDR